MKHCCRGFSLIELSVVIVIIGLLAAAGLAFINIKETQKKLENTPIELASNARLLADYTAKDADDDGTPDHPRLPCPSSLDLKPGDADFGIEQCPSMTAADGTNYNGVRVSVTPSGKRVFIGAFPTSTLETLGEHAIDPYGHMFVYAVSADLTVDGAVTDTNPLGDISVNLNSGGATITATDKPFIIVSTGRNGLNSTAINGDGENIDFDYTFSAFTGNVERDGNNYFDDRVTFAFGSDTDAQGAIILGFVDVYANNPPSYGINTVACRNNWGPASCDCRVFPGGGGPFDAGSYACEVTCTKGKPRLVSGPSRPVYSSSGCQNSQPANFEGTYIADFSVATVACVMTNEALPNMIKVSGPTAVWSPRPITECNNGSNGGNGG